MREGSPFDRLKQGLSRDLQRLANKTLAAPTVIQKPRTAWYRTLWRFLRGFTRSDWIAAAALLVALSGAFYTSKQAEYASQQNELTRQSLKLHVDPEVQCSLGNLHDKYPLFSVVNEGPSAAESVIVDHLILFYLKKGEYAGKLKGSGEEGVVTFPRSPWLYASKLEPNAHTAPKETARFSYTVPDKISILFFKVTYLRPTDGKRYEKRCFFYKEGDHRYQDRPSFESNPHFAAVNAEIDRHLAKVLSLSAMETAAEELRD